MTNAVRSIGQVEAGAVARPSALELNAPRWTEVDGYSCGPLIRCLQRWTSTYGRVSRDADPPAVADDWRIGNTAHGFDSLAPALLGRGWGTGHRRWTRTGQHGGS